MATLRHPHLSPTRIAVLVLLISIAAIPDLYYLAWNIPHLLFALAPSHLPIPPTHTIPSFPPPPPPPTPTPTLPPTPSPALSAATTAAAATTTAAAAAAATMSSAATTSWLQRQITLPARPRGSYLITSEVVDALPELREYKIGLLNLFVQHTSCALSLNENWDEDVRADMSDALDRIVPEEGPGGEELYRHSAEGPDDMPAHIKTALIGASVTIPIRDGKLATGDWQGIWHLEFRASRHHRKVLATIQGEKA